MSSKKHGLLLVGASGMTASAVISGLERILSGSVPEEYGSSSLDVFDGMQLISAEDVILGGWDCHSEDVWEGPRRYNYLSHDGNNLSSFPLFPAVVSAIDYPTDTDAVHVVKPNNLDAGASIVEKNITQFKTETGVGSVTVVYLANPPKYDDEYWSTQDIGEDNQFPSGFMYCLGSIRAGANFVDYTPSPTLANRAIWDLATAAGTLLSGRDGSTGQTMVKQTLSELYYRRNLKIDAWYSTNVIGNRDGLVVSNPEYNKSKIADKSDALRGHREDSHLVRIDYVEHWGDRKEAWDAIELSSWMETNLSMRVNARGEDSFLAAPMVLDIFRFVVSLSERGKNGFVPELGFFYKRPFEREETTISQRWDELVNLFT